MQNRIVHRVVFHLGVFILVLFPLTLLGQEPVLIPVKSDNTRRENGTRGRQQVWVDVYQHGLDDWQPAWMPVPPPPASFNLAQQQTQRPTLPASADSTGGQVRRKRQTQGFRVQLANVMSEDQARAIETRAKPLFDAIYITFRSPNYKVRAGDFTKRSDADRAAAEAKALGFRSAWVVPDRVFVEE